MKINKVSRIISISCLQQWLKIGSLGKCIKKSKAFTIPLSIIFPQLLTASFRLGPWKRTAFDRSSLCVQWKAAFSLVDVFFSITLWTIQTVPYTGWKDAYSLTRCYMKKHTMLLWSPYTDSFFWYSCHCIRMWRNDLFSHSSCHQFGHHSSLQESRLTILRLFNNFFFRKLSRILIILTVRSSF